MTINVYHRLTERLELTGSERLMAILEYLMTPEQAEVAMGLPGFPEEIAQKTGFDLVRVRSILDELYYKGVIIPRDRQKEDYKLVWLLQLHDSTLSNQQIDPVKDKAFLEMWQDFTDHELASYIAIDFADKLQRPMFRVIPAMKAIKDIPDVLPWENFQEIVKAQEVIAVVPCACRWQTTGAGRHCEYTKETEQWKCIQFGKSAKYAIERGSGKQITQEECLKVADLAEEEGLVRLWSYFATMQSNSVCQCCQDCCMIFVPTQQYNVDITKLLAKSRYVAQVMEDDCSGCQNCLERCHFNAIDLVRSGKKYKAIVDQEKCGGCGVCVLKCETGAIKIKAVRPPEFIPQKVR